MIELSRPQLSFAEGLIEEEVGPLWEEWMRQVDALLADRELVQIVYEALARRYPQSRTRGRPATPAEVVLRLLLLKHMRNWSYRVLEREVRANLVYRQFTRVGAQKVPDAKTLGRLAIALGPEIIEQIHRRVVAIACEKRIIRGRRLRLDTTVVETDIHYPTDSSLLGDGVRVLTRAMKRIAKIAGRAGSAPGTAIYCVPPSRYIASSWDACRICSPPTLPSSRSTMRLPREPRASSEWPSPIALPGGARSANDWRRNAGSATPRSGAPAVKAASVCSSAATA
jgi:hypothetical protein